MFIKHLRGAAFCAALTLAALPASAEDYANPHLLTTVDALASTATVSPLDGQVTYGHSAVVIDVRPAAAYGEGHLPGARHLEPDAVADPDSPVSGALRSISDLTDLFVDLGISPETEVILYDDRGGFHAARVFWVLEYLGHRQVSLLDGGIQAWTANGHGVEAGPDVAEIMPGQFAPAVSPRRFASADWILQRRDDADTVVIDVRPTHLFAEGHIPWAQNIPWSQNLAEDQTMKSAVALRAHFEAHGVTPDDNIVVHCQNGLASAHSYFALRLLGYPQVRTYHRSWAEWGSAGDLPIATADAG